MTASMPSATWNCVWMNFRLVSLVFRCSFFGENQDKRVETYVNIFAVVIECSVGNTNEAGFLDDANKPRAENQWFGLGDDAEEVPPRGEANSLLQAAGANIADRGGASVCQEEDRDGRLLEGQQKADVWVER